MRSLTFYICIVISLWLLTVEKQIATVTTHHCSFSANGSNKEFHYVDIRLKNSKSSMIFKYHNERDIQYDHASPSAWRYLFSKGEGVYSSKGWAVSSKDQQEKGLILILLCANVYLLVISMLGYYTSRGMSKPFAIITRMNLNWYFSLAQYITVHVHDRHRVMTQCTLGLPTVTCQQGASPQSNILNHCSALGNKSWKGPKRIFFCW